MSTARLKLNSSAEIAAIVPTLFEFPPVHSVVVIGLEDRKVGMSMRVDCPPPGELLALVRDHFPTGTTLITAIYDNDHSYARSILDTLRPLYEIKECLRIDDGLWYPVLCTEPKCCSQDGRPVEAVSDAMTAALGARAMSSSREELRKRYASDDVLSVESMRLLEIEPVESAIQRLSDMQDAVADGAQVPDAFVAQMLVNLSNLFIRDHLIAWTMRSDTEQETEEVCAYLARRAPGGFIAPPATVAGVLAWQLGKGTRARMAIEAALADDPGYHFARLIEQALDCGMHPQTWKEAVADVMPMD